MSLRSMPHSSTTEKFAYLRRSLVSPYGTTSRKAQAVLSELEEQLEAAQKERDHYRWHWDKSEEQLEALRGALGLAEDVVDAYGRYWAKDERYYAFMDVLATLSNPATGLSVSWRDPTTGESSPARER